MLRIVVVVLRMMELGRRKCNKQIYGTVKLQSICHVVNDAKDELLRKITRKRTTYILANSNY